MWYKTVCFFIVSVSYPGNFWSLYTGLATKFNQQMINSLLLCEISQNLDILDTYLGIKYCMAREKHGDFMKKHATAT